MSWRAGEAAGITGGFAGGERGLQQLVEKGEIKLAEPGKSAHPTHPTLPLCFLACLGHCVCQVCLLR